MDIIQRVNEEELSGRRDIKAEEDEPELVELTVEEEVKKGR